MKLLCRAIEDGLTTTTFEITPIMSTYLLAFTVSEFRSRAILTSNVSFKVYSSQKTLNSMQYALDTGVAALEALEDYIGHNYTLNKMDFLAIDDFLMGAMVRLIRNSRKFFNNLELFSGKLGTGYI